MRRCRLSAWPSARATSRALDTDAVGAHTRSPALLHVGGAGRAPWAAACEKRGKGALGDRAPEGRAGQRPPNPNPSTAQVYTNLYWTLPRDRLEGGPRAAAAPDLATQSLTPFLGAAAPAVLERAEAAAPLVEADPLELASMERQAVGGSLPV